MSTCGEWEWYSLLQADWCLIYFLVCFPKWPKLPPTRAAQTLGLRSTKLSSLFTAILAGFTAPLRLAECGETLLQWRRAFCVGRSPIGAALKRARLESSSNRALWQWLYGLKLKIAGHPTCSAAWPMCLDSVASVKWESNNSMNIPAWSRMGAARTPTHWDLGATSAGGHYFLVSLPLTNMAAVVFGRVYCGCSESQGWAIGSTALPLPRSCRVKPGLCR